MPLKFRTEVKADSMKADEVLERYREGERNFRRVNLIGQSFKGKNLSRADFSEADIRGANFTNANLSGANFHGALAGLQHRWAIGLVLASWLISGISAISSVFAGVFVSLALDTSNPKDFSAGIISLIVLTVFFIVTIRYGLAAGSIAFAFAFAGAFAFAVAFAFAGAFAVAFAEAVAFAGALAVVGAFAVAGAGAGAVAFAFAFAVAVAVAGAGAGAVAVAVAVAVAFAVTVFRIVTVAGAVAGAVAVTVAVAMLGVYVGWRGLAGDEKHAWVRPFVIAFAAKGGTSFRGANLTNANFTSATLKSTDFRDAILTRTCWAQAKQLDRVRPGKTYLRDVQLRQWLIGNGLNKNFDRQDLRGVNLKGANLADVSFIGADLSKANLQDADLSRAKLVQTQLDETDLTGATLTGACIEDWGITSHTKLDGVSCEYVFMRDVKQGDPDQNPRRKPDNWAETFSDGDFADFIQPIVDTLDLYHNQGVDPRAIAISFKQLAENHPDAELRVVGMEVRGEDKFLLKAKTAPDANKSQLSAEYSSTYSQLKALPDKEINLIIAEKDKHILRLENMVITALEHPSFYSNVEQVSNMTHNPGGISQSVSGGQMYGGMQAAQGDNNQQTQETNVAASNEKQLTQQEVIQMLAQIEELVGGSPELPEADKEKSLKYLGAALAEVREPEPDKQLVAGSVKRMSETLKTASETVASGKTLWENVKPILVQLPGWLGVAKGFFGF